MVATGATQPRPVNTKFGFVVATAVGDEVAEANFKPATALSTETLPERKVACITAFTSEVARHANPAALEAVNRELLGGLAAAADQLFSVTLSIPSALLIYRWKRHGRGRYRRLSECIKRNGWQF